MHTSKAMYASWFLCAWLCCLGPVRGQLDINFFLTPADKAALETPEVVHQKWELLISRAKEGIDYAVKMAMSQVMSGGNITANISASCMRDSMKILHGIRKLRLWALKFFDASAKSIDGSLGITFASLGCYDECIKNVVMDERYSKRHNVLFKGKYCLVNMKPYLPRLEYGLQPMANMTSLLKDLPFEGTFFEQTVNMSTLLYVRSVAVGLCIPSGCSDDDLNQLVTQGGDYIGIAARVTRCLTNDDEYVKVDNRQIAIMTGFSLFGLLMLLGTLLSVYTYCTGKKFEGTFYSYLLAFSFIRNFQKLAETPSSSDLKCLHGIRFLTMAWVIVGHTYGAVALSMHYIREDLQEYGLTFAFQAIINGALSVDTFFFMTGLLVCYTTTKMVKHGKGKLNIPMYIIHRVWRLIPVYAAVIAYTFLVPLTITGPFKTDVEKALIPPCEKNWWASLLFVNNIYDELNKCVGQGWYLTVDMQLYIASLLVLVPLMRSAKWGIGIGVSLIVATMISTAAVGYVYNIPPTFFINFENIQRDLDFGVVDYNKPLSHAPVWGIGLLTGYLLAMYPKLKIPKVVQVLGWCISHIFCMIVIYGTYDWNHGGKPTAVEAFLYSSCYRALWGLGISWIIVCCCTGHGGVINYLLSWKVWVPLSKLTFVAYLIHPILMATYMGNLTQVVSLPYHYMIIWLFFGYLVISYGVAFVGSMLIELPFTNLEKLIFFKPAAKKVSDTNKEDDYSVHDDESKSKNAFNGTFVATDGVVNTQYVQKIEM